MTNRERIRIILVKRGNISESELARRCGWFPQNLHNKMRRDNVTERELTIIAEALNCSLSIRFVISDTGGAI